MAKKWSWLLVWGLLATPASAYPTSLISAPTADILETGTHHFGLYTYKPGAFNYDFSYNLGLFEGFKLGDFRVGALEAGFDATYPEDFIGASFSGSFKLGLLSESELLPGLALGTFYHGIPNAQNTPNFKYLSATKAMAPGGIDLGAWTLGGYQLSQDYAGSAANMGYFFGFSRDLGERFSVTADYTSGQSGMSGTNVALSFSPTEALSITGGYYLSGAGAEGNAPFVFLDYNLPFGASEEKE